MEVGMMFRKLSRGAKFDTERFMSDAQKLQIVRTPDFTPPPSLSLQMKNNKMKSEEDTTTTVKIENDGIEIETKSSLKKHRKKKQQVVSNIVNLLRKSNRIHIWGSDLPDPIENFHDISTMSPQLLQNIQNSDYNVPTPVQMQAIPIILSGREVLASAPTGSGKTAGFLIPIILLLGSKSIPSSVSVSKGFRALILSPTRELAKQIYRECVRLSDGTGLFTYILDGKSKKNIHGDILISTPNRLVYQLKNETISLKNIKHFIVDECDHLFESGFIDQLGFIYSSCDCPEIKRGFFSATCAFEVEEFCKTHLDNHILMTVGGGKNSTGADLIEQSVIFTGTEAGKLVGFRDLLRKGIEPPVLVFVQSQDRANQLLSELVFEGIKCDVIHSGKSEIQRENIIENFRAGKIWILVCTALLSRGLDFPAVKLVINYDMPTTPIQYIHAIGRTGRAGRLGKAITFYTEDDKPILRRTAQVLENSGFPVPSYLLKMKKIRKDEGLRQSRRPLKRARITKISQYDIEKKFKLKQMVQHSKKIHNSNNLEVQKVEDGEKITKQQQRRKKRKNVGGGGGNIEINLDVLEHSKKNKTKNVGDNVEINLVVPEHSKIKRKKRRKTE